MERASDGRVDRVLLAAALLTAAAAAALPLVTVRPNRLAAGVAHPLSAGGAAGWAVLAFAALAAAAAFAREARVRGPLALVAAAGSISALALAAGRAASSLAPAAGPLARVSLASGAWLALAGGAAIAYAGDAASGRRPLPRLALAGALALGAALAVAGGLGRLSIAVEYGVQRDVFWPLLRGHLALAGAALLVATVIGVPLGIVAARAPRVRRVALAVTGAIQTIPSLALLGLLVAPLAALVTVLPALGALGVGGIGYAPSLVALTLYALLPVLRDTYLGLAGVDPAAIDAGRGMGMTPRQLLARVRLPLALPLVIEGVRIAAVLLIGIATVTALAGARTLGNLVFDGLSQGAIDLTLLGALPTIVLAVAADQLLRALGRAITPRGVRP